jgi:hypothetical protein
MLRGRDQDAIAYDLTSGVTLDRQPLPSVVPEGHIGLVLQIENTYELYDDVTTYASVSVPSPPSNEGEDDASVQARTDWSWDHIDPLTGVGHTDGDSWYNVTVLESSDPTVIPVDTTWDFGY